MNQTLHFTVRQLADLAGVSTRTLHYYDQIGLLLPSRNQENGYRYYERPAVLRLQQILFLRELGLSLEAIREVLDQPGFDLLGTLEQHRAELRTRQARLQVLLQTVERTIQHIKGEINMESKELFAGFSEEKQKEYEVEARRRYGEKHVKESQRRWGSYSAEKKQKVMEEGRDIYLDLIAAIPLGPTSQPAQDGIARWHQHLRYFYEPTDEILLGLGDRYNDDPEFYANFQQMHPQLAEFMRAAIKVYVAGKKG